MTRSKGRISLSFYTVEGLIMPAIPLLPLSFLLLVSQHGISQVEFPGHSGRLYVY